MTYTHGETRSPTHTVWANMRQRCNDPNTPRYKDYGGRGIKVCKEWDDYLTFLKDMGECPHNKTLDRKDNNGNYCKDNCQWATRSEQTLNQRVRQDNSSGIKGVWFEASRNRWRACGNKDGRQERFKGEGTLLNACAGRKSWELKNGVPQYDN